MTLQHTEHIEQMLGLARRLEARAQVLHQDARVAEAQELYDRARALRHEAQESHNAHVVAELDRARTEPVNLTDLMAGREAFTLDELDRATGEGRR